MKTKVIAFTKDKYYVSVLKEMVEDRLAYEAPPNTFHLIYPLEEMNRFKQAILED